MTRDAIIVGAGHNGLVAACYLARAGLKPLVLERRAVVGGALTTTEFHPGFRGAIFAHAGGELRPAIARDLQIERLGAVVVRPEPYVFALTPEGRGLPLYRDPSRTARELLGFSDQDATRYPEFHETLARIARALDPFVSLSPPSLDQVHVSEWWAYVAGGRAVRALDRRDGYRLLRWVTMPVADLVGEWFETDLVRATLAAPALVGSFAGPRSPGTGALLVLHATLDGHVGGPGSFVHGGPGALTAALAAAAVRMGAEIRTDAAVARIEVQDGAVSGVTLESGETIPCRTIVSNADPRRTLLALVDPEHLDPAVRHAYSRVRCRGATAKINLALAGLPRFSALDTLAGANDAETVSRRFLSGRIHIGPGIDYLERAFDAAKYGEISPRPHLDVTIPTLTDASLAPPGAHVASICAQFAPYHLRGAPWDLRRDELANLVVGTLEEYAPTLRKLIVGCQVLTPLDLERELGLTGGQIYHGEPALDQLFATRPVFGGARYRTPIAGLYLCGAGTHPGLGTTGAGGANASREILGDLRKK